MKLNSKGRQSGFMAMPTTIFIFSFLMSVVRVISLQRPADTAGIQAHRLMRTEKAQKQRKSVPISQDGEPEPALGRRVTTTKPTPVASMIFTPDGKVGPVVEGDATTTKMGTTISKDFGGQLIGSEEAHGLQHSSTDAKEKSKSISFVISEDGLDGQPGLTPDAHKRLIRSPKAERIHRQRESPKTALAGADGAVKQWSSLLEKTTETALTGVEGAVNQVSDLLEKTTQPWGLIVMVTVVALVFLSCIGAFIAHQMRGSGDRRSAQLLLDSEDAGEEDAGEATGSTGETDGDSPSQKKRLTKIIEKQRSRQSSVERNQ